MNSPILYIGSVQFHFQVSPAMRFRYSKRKMVELLANSGCHEWRHSAVSDLGLHCLPIILLGVSRLQLVKVKGYTSECFISGKRMCTSTG